MSGSPTASRPEKPIRSSASNPRSREDLLSPILETAGLAIWEAWADTLTITRLDVGRKRRSIFALEPAQTQPGTSWEESIYPLDRTRVRTLLQRPVSSRTSWPIEYRLIVGDGELLWVRHWPLHPLPPLRGRHRLRGLLMAIPEQKQLEWECLRASERESARIGQELHDDLCQVLAGLTFMLRVLGRRAADLSTSLAGELAKQEAELQRATERVRAMAHGLFPAQLNFTSLRQALQEFARQCEPRFDIKVRLDLAPKLPPQSPEQIMHVYRIAQEAVSNAVHHGRATCVTISVSVNNGELRMNVRDNGTGFPSARRRPEGIGMHVMQYRAGLLGGDLRGANVAPRGAAVHLTYALDAGHAQTPAKRIPPA